MKAVYHGSVKDLYRTKEQKMIFLFSDRYSVFDWGEMPDHLKLKGQSLTRIAHLFFKMLSDSHFWRTLDNGLITSDSLLFERFCVHGLPHHYIGPVTNDGLMGEVEGSVSGLKVEEVQVLRPLYIQDKHTYDYSAYLKQPTNALVPLEMIFRFGLTEGSSLFDRAADQNYLAQLGLSSEDLVPGKMFKKPVIEFSTKLEERDRYLSYQQAQSISGMTDQEWSELLETVSLVALAIHKVWSLANVSCLDGKIEMAFIEGDVHRHFMLVDSIGPDELRLSHDGVELSKECLRKFYRKDQKWFSSLKTAKQKADEQGVQDWKKLALELHPAGPAPLPANIKTAVEMLYRTLTQELYRTHLNLTIDSSAWSLDKLSHNLRGLL